MRQIPTSTGHCVGIPWFRPHDYPDALAVMDDHQLPATWAGWLERAERLEERSQERGVQVIRAPLTPATFKSWCRAHGFPLADASARVAYASEYAARMVWH